MAQSLCAAIFRLFLLSAIFLNFVGSACAVPVVWTNGPITFTKSGVNTSNTADPANQDRLTSNVWITRGGAASGGIFNVAVGKETEYDMAGFISPANTLWATSVMPANEGKTIAATNFSQLSFTTWAEAYDGPGSALFNNITTHNAVVHLLSDDIYLDLNFLLPFTSSGVFTYQRSTPPPPTGDYNKNTVVDAADYVMWRTSLNQLVSARGSGADGDYDAKITSFDYDYWRARFGNPAPGAGTAASTTVPEPAAASLLAIGLLVFAGRGPC